jgi:GAF domain-containing protein
MAFKNKRAWVSPALLAGGLIALLWTNVTQPVAWGEMWLPILLFSITFALVNNLDLILSTSYTGAVHVVLLTAFLATGLTPALWLVVLGTVLAAALNQFLTRRTPITLNLPLDVWRFVTAGGTYGISLCVAGLIYQIGGQVATADWGWRDFLAMVMLYGSYFLVHNALYACQLYARRESVPQYFHHHLEQILRRQLVPLACSTLFAAIYLYLAPWVLFVLCAASIGVGILVYRLRETRRELDKRLHERHILSKVGQILATTSLEIDVLLNAFYHQIRQLMEADYFYIALYDAATDELTFPVLVEGGERKRISSRRAGNGLTEYVIRQRKPVLIPENTAHVIANLGLEVIGKPALSWLGVPLTASDRVLGVMAVQSFSRSYAYSQEDLSLLTTLATQAAIAMENAQLYGQMRRRTAEMALLNTVSSAVNSTLDLDQVLQIVVTSIMPIMFCQKAALYLLDSPDGKLQLRTAQGLSQEFKKSLVWQDNVRFQRVRDQNMVIVPDVATSKLPAAEIRLALEEGYRAFAETLLITQNEPIGMLGIYYEQVHYLDLAERDLLITFANQVSTAIANARLYSHTDQALARRVEELSVIERIGRELTSTLEPRRVIDLVLEQAMSATNATQGYIAMSNDGAQHQVNIVTQQGYADEITHRALSASGSSGNGVVERVLRDGQLTLVRDVQRNSSGAPLDPSIRALLTVPILREGTVLGAINLESNRVNGFDDQDANFVSQLATQAAVALKNAQLFQERSQRVEELSLLYQASLALASSLEYDDVLDIISRLARHITNSDSVTLYLYDATHDRFEQATSQGYRAEETHPSGIRRQGTTRTIIETKQPLLIHDTLTYPNINPLVLERETRAVIGVPVMSQGEVLGVLYINHRRPHIYSENDVRLIGALANQAGATMSNVELFNQVSQARDRLEAIINSTRDGILVLDNSGCVVIANARMRLFSELRRDQLVGRTVEELIQDHPGELMNFLGLTLDDLSTWATSLQTDPTKSSSRTFQIPISEGASSQPQRTHTRSAELFGMPVLDKENQVIGRLMVFRDITEEKELEKMREDLTGMMVHDLRSPLAAVLSGLEMIQELTASEDSDPLAVHAMRVAKRSCNSMLTLVNSLLDINQLESGRMPLLRAPAPFAPLVRSAVARLSALADERGVIVHTELPLDLPMVEMDNEKIGRVLINLLDNALKFTPDGGQITLCAVREIRKKENVLLCSVSDTGPGIPPEYREKVFDRFAQVHGQTAPRGPRGSGLGLAFCKLAVEAHNGRIWVETEPGQGCTFYFTLPVAEIDAWLDE